MPVYRLIRHVIYCPRTQGTREVWGIDRPQGPASSVVLRTPCGQSVLGQQGPALPVAGAPIFTDADDPLGSGACSPLLLLPDGDYVSWSRMMEWLSFAATAGYTLVSGYENLSPYSTMIIQI